MLDYDSLNPQQREAVMTTEGPLLVLAGAGSGKTRVLTYRIAHLIADCGVEPFRILAITFTNKAAGEMRSRLRGLIGDAARSMWVSTFHSMCVRILRANAERIGFTPTFTIYDDDDSKRLFKEIIKQRNLVDAVSSLNAIRGRISQAKNDLIGPAEFARDAHTPSEKMTADIYGDYAARLKAANALDFDDLLFFTVQLFLDAPEVLAAYQERFAYIHVDEYQDTNHAQYRITNLLAARSRNLMVVGDDDQSIYSWRGADVTNILEFERDYPEARTVKLEQNYRSTQTILDAANAVVAHNAVRKSKRLFTKGEQGTPIEVYLATTEKDEAGYIAGEIDRLCAKGERLYRDCAIFYRTNAQSRNIEDALLRAGIPYTIVGGTKFFERAEIRDVMAYLKAVVNPADDISCKRIINTPRRGLGKTTVDYVSGLAYEEGLTFEQAIERALAKAELRSSAIGALDGFLGTLHAMRALQGRLDEVVEMIIDKTGLIAAYEAERTDEAHNRIENIKEFVCVVNDFVEAHDDDEATLAGFMEWLALRSDLDTLGDADDAVTMMTVHTAKGLEFPVVFISGLEEDIFPHQNSIFSEGGIEEERRLMYVALTRARERLYLTYAAARRTFNQVTYNPASRFIAEIPAELVHASQVGSDAYSGFGHDKRGDRHGTSAHGAPRYLGGDVFGGGFDPSREKDLGRAYGAGRRAAAKKGTERDFSAGDRVDHKTFGRGTVVAVAGDSVEIAFDGAAGTKKLLLGYAPLVKITDGR